MRYQSFFGCRRLTAAMLAAAITTTGSFADRADAQERVSDGMRAPTIGATPFGGDAPPAAASSSTPSVEGQYYSDAPTMNFSDSGYDMSGYAEPCTACESGCSKEDKEAATKKMKGAFKGLFYDNDFSYLSDPCYDGPRYFSDQFKNMETRFGTFSFGGETRLRYMDERNFRGLGLTGNDDDYLLQRQRYYANWKINDTFRVYGELLDANSSFEDFNPRPIDENDLDVQNLFLDVKLWDNGTSSLTARGGRQELLYGSQRTRLAIGLGEHPSYV